MFAPGDRSRSGAVAQLVAHHTGSVGVRGSSPLSSTYRRPRIYLPMASSGFQQFKINRRLVRKKSARATRSLPTLTNPPAPRPTRVSPLGWTRGRPAPRGQVTKGGPAGSSLGDPPGARAVKAAARPYGIELRSWCWWCQRAPPSNGPAVRGDATLRVPGWGLSATCSSGDVQLSAVNDEQVSNVGH